MLRVLLEIREDTIVKTGIAHSWSPSLVRQIQMSLPDTESAGSCTLHALSFIESASFAVCLFRMSSHRT
jgi:hypothetical protein